MTSNAGNDLLNAIHIMFIRMFSSTVRLKLYFPVNSTTCEINIYHNNKCDDIFCAVKQISSDTNCQCRTIFIHSIAVWIWWLIKCSGDSNKCSINITLRFRYKFWLISMIFAIWTKLIKYTKLRLPSEWVSRWPNGCQIFQKWIYWNIQKT